MACESWEGMHAVAGLTRRCLGIRPLASACQAATASRCGAGSSAERAVLAATCTQGLLGDLGAADAGK